MKKSISKPLLLLTLSSLLIVSGCAGTSSEKGETSQAKKAKSDLICRYEKTTGSHMKKKICRTKEQMEMQEKVGQKAVGSATKSSQTGLR